MSSRGENALFIRYTQDTAQYGSLATSIVSNLGSKAIANREDLFQQLTAVKDQLVIMMEGRRGAHTFLGCDLRFE